MDWRLRDYSFPFLLALALHAVALAGLINTWHPSRDVVEVIKPAVRRSVRATRDGSIGVIGTVATVTSGAYEDAFAFVILVAILIVRPDGLLGRSQTQRV